MPAEPTAPVFLQLFQNLVPTHLDTPWATEDGLEPGELDALLAASPAAQVSGDGTVPVPLALYEFHRALGNCSELLETDHFFFDADELDIRDGYLMFLEDANEQTVWGLPVADAELPDPLVWRRSTGADQDHGEWTCEDGTFSEFTLDLLDWTFEEEAQENSAWE
ncbi:hypothetical protein [Citricoccus sp. GCM10030269]|uniref:hypothetical protein n=1 Tax=Citricoccus sp. GCM10030269 TaxID=3273388 RepID=UPI003612DD34